MKNAICTTIGTIGAVIAGFFGGWDEAIKTLLIFMTIDYITGLIVAGVFKKSPKTSSGKLSSKIGYKGLCKKCMILFFVLVGNRLDITFESNYIRDAVCITFITNELISIVENADIMGFPLPKPIKNAIELLKNKEDN